jgi:hypothetical protein
MREHAGRFVERRKSSRMRLQQLHIRPERGLAPVEAVGVRHR